MVSGGKKMLLYTIINENNYPGQGHIINIAKRHTNRRWRQYTPEKQCIIQLELVKASMVTWLELRGYGTYILQIVFKNIQNKVITMIKYNFNFSDKQSINQPIACEQVVKYVSVKLVNSQQNPQRMGLDHFFMKGKVTQKSQSDEQNNYNNQQIKRNKIEEDEEAQYYNRKQKTKKQQRGKRKNEQDQYVYQLKNEQKVKADKKDKKIKEGKQINRSNNKPKTIVEIKIKTKIRFNCQYCFHNNKITNKSEIINKTNASKIIISSTINKQQSWLIKIKLNFYKLNKISNINNSIVKKINKTAINIEIKKKKQQIARSVNHIIQSNLLIKKEQV